MDQKAVAEIENITNLEIEDEILRARNTHGEDWQIHFFNNFHLKLPSPYDGNLDVVLPRNNHQKQNTWKVRYREGADPRHSKLYKENTPMNFFGDIDRTLKEAGIDLEEVRRLQKERKVKELLELVKP